MAYIPFPKPIPVPGTSINAVPGNSICFSEEWTPAVLGALKSLARPETWSGDETDISDAVREAHTLLAVSSEYAPCVENPNWRLFMAPNSICTSLSTNVVFWPVFDAVTSEPRTFVGLAGQKVEGEDLFRIAVTGQEIAPLFPSAGGNIIELEAHQIGVTIGNVWLLQWRDCFGALHTESDGSFILLRTNFEAKDICVTSTAPFGISFSISPSAVCLSA